MIRCQLTCDKCNKTLKEPPWLTFTNVGFVRAEAKRMGWIQRKKSFGMKEDLCKECSDA